MANLRSKHHLGIMDPGKAIMATKRRKLTLDKSARCILDFSTRTGRTRAVAMRITKRGFRTRLAGRGGGCHFSFRATTSLASGGVSFSLKLKAAMCLSSIQVSRSDLVGGKDFGTNVTNFRICYCAPSGMACIISSLGRSGTTSFAVGSAKRTS